MPKATGFVFVGLLLLKMILAAVFLQKIGWLATGIPITTKAFFMLFYAIYTLILVLLSVKLLKQLDQSH